MLAMVFALVLAGTDAPAEPPAPFVTQPVWLKLPSGDAMDRYRPEDAKAPGRAVVECTVSARGLLEYCQTLEETPDEQYGAAAVRIAALFQMGPQDKAGVATAGRKVRIPLSWTLPTPPSSGDFVRPKALAKPGGPDMVKAYPGKAVSDELSGRGVIVCQLTASGRLESCVVEDETPPGFGFGKAALSLAPRFRFATTDADGKSVVGGKIRIPLVWNAPPGD